jgi:sulfane dehydrogenase subunit SoxC
MGRQDTQPPDDIESVAGNGLLHRRLFLTGGAALAAAGYAPRDTAFAELLPVEPWMIS